MELVITNGRVNLVPIEGKEEGTRAGYYLRITDQDGSNITVVAPMPYAESGQLAAAINADMEAHPHGEVAGGTGIEVVPAAVLHALKDHRAPGGGSRHG